MTTKSTSRPLSKLAGKPFGPYEDFDACVADNQDKNDPEAFCAELEKIVAEQTAEEEEADSAVNAKKREVEKTRELLSNALQEQFRNFSWVMTYDPEEKWVVFEESNGMDGSSRALLMVSYEDSGDEITLSGEPPVEVERETETKYVPKGTQRGELTGPFVFKDSKKQIGYAAVLVPGEPDSDGETLTAAKIEEVAHGWMESYRNIDLQHTLNNIDALPVESHVLRQAESVSINGEVMTLPTGTWVLASKFNDANTWKAIESGKYQGYSVMGVQRAVVKEAAIKSQAFAFKKTLLEDLGDDWVATHVSVVDEPAVPKAKWFALKAATPDKQTFLDKMKDAFSVKEGRRFSEKTYKTLKAAQEAMAALIKEAEEERTRRSAKSQLEDAPNSVGQVTLDATVIAEVKKAIAKE